MMNIAEKIEEICADKLCDYTFILDNWYDADRKLARLDLPAIICVLPVSGAIELKNGRRKFSQNIAIAFVDKVRRDASGDDNNEVTNKMMNAAALFIEGFNACGAFESLDGKQNVSMIYEGTSTIVSGVMLDINVTELNGECYDGR